MLNVDFFLLKIRISSKVTKDMSELSFFNPVLEKMSCFPNNISNINVGARHLVGTCMVALDEH